MVEDPNKNGVDVGIFSGEDLPVVEANNGVGVVSSFVLEDQFLQEQFLGIDDVPANMAFRNILARFDDYVDALNLRDAEFFEHEGMQQDFLERFKYFMNNVDNRISILKEKLVFFDGLHDFPIDWEAIVKEVCYYCFFVHFGAKRKRQSDEFGRPQDYVYHVVRTAFDKLMGAVEFPKFKFFITALLHDTREDFEKGFAGVLYSEKTDLDIYSEKIKGGESGSGQLNTGSKIAKNNKDKILPEMLVMEDDLTDRLKIDESSELTFSECIDILTKQTSDRDIAFLEMLAKIFKHNGGKRFDAILVLLDKIADRLENSESENVERIQEETRFLFIPICIGMGMWATLDSFYDLLYFVDYELRRKWATLNAISDDDEGGEMPVTAEFYNTFEKELNCMSGFANAKNGKDYVIRLRPVGLRYASYEKALLMAEEGDYTKAFRSYVHFYPIVKNPAMVSAAVRVFKKLFPKDLSGSRRKDLERPELRNLLGGVVLKNRRGIPLRKHGYSDKYGIGVWGVDDSRRDAIRNVNGDPHVATFYRGHDANFSKARMLSLFSGMEPDVKRLISQYYAFMNNSKNVDFTVSPDGIADKVLADVAVVFQDYGKEAVKEIGCLLRIFCSNNASNMEDWSVNFSALLKKLVMSILMKKGKSVIVKIDNRVYDIALPEGVKDEDSFFWAEPLSVGRSIKTFKAGGDQKQRELVFTLSDEYSSDVANVQLVGVDKRMARYRNNLLTDDLGGKRRSSKLSSN